MSDQGNAPAPVSTISQAAADWAANLSSAQIPGEVVEQTKLRILDVVGVMLAAKPADVVTRARGAALETECGTGTFIIGFPGETSLAAAALVNGVMSAVLEFDDTHIETAIHPTAPVVSAGVPQCGQLGLSGRKLTEAVLIGSELTCRIGQIAPGFHGLGIHPTGVFGIFGAVYTLARLLSLKPDEIVHGIGLAGSMAAGSMASWDDGSDAKSMQVGLAASAAVRAVALARHGVSGPASVFEGRFGFFRSHVQARDSDFRFAALTHRLGSEWETLNIASKAYPSAFVIHPFVDAAFALKAEHRITPGDIDELVCVVSDFVMATVCEPRPEKLRPRTTWHARISLQHMVAEAMVTGVMDKSSFSPRNLRDARINALADKVRCVADPEAFDRKRSGGEVRIRLRGGREVRHAIEHMRGTRSNPISRDDFIAKFRANAADVVAPALIDETIDGVLGLERVDDVAGLFKKLSS